MGNGSENLLSIVLPTILGSTFLTALLNIGGNYFKDSREAKITNITQERKEWRNRIREISDQIQNKKGKKLANFLNTLKVNINPYGKIAFDAFNKIEGEPTDKQWMSLIPSDGYVWMAIADIESNINSVSSDELDRLTEVLGILLKLDWERSKKEIKGERLQTLIISSFIVFYLLCVMYYIGLFFSGFNVQSTWIGMGIFTISIFAPFIISYYSKKEVGSKPLTTKVFWIPMISVLVPMVGSVRIYKPDIMLIGILMTLFLGALLVLLGQYHITNMTEIKQTTETLKIIFRTNPE